MLYSTGRPNEGSGRAAVNINVLQPIVSPLLSSRVVDVSANAWHTLAVLETGVCMALKVMPERCSATPPCQGRVALTECFACLGRAQVWC